MHPVSAILVVSRAELVGRGLISGPVALAGEVLSVLMGLTFASAAVRQVDLPRCPPRLHGAGTGQVVGVGGVRVVSSGGRSPRLRHW